MDQKEVHHGYDPVQESYHQSHSSKPDFLDLSSNQVLDEFVAMEILDSTTEMKLTRQSGTKMPSLALKAKEVQVEEDDDEEDAGPEDTKYDFNEHMALASRQFWGNNKNFKPTRVASSLRVKE